MSVSSFFSSSALFIIDCDDEALEKTTVYRAVDAVRLRSTLCDIAAAILKNAGTNESLPEDDAYWPALHSLGCIGSLRQQNPTVTGRNGIPHVSLFADAALTQSHKDIGYIYSTFPIVDDDEMAKSGSYRRRDLALTRINTPFVGQRDGEVWA